MSGFEDHHGARVVPDDELRIAWSAHTHNTGREPRIEYPQHQTTAR